MILKVLSIFTVVTLVSCRVEKNEQAEVLYSSDAFLSSHSLLPEINKTGRVEACFQPIGGSQTERQETFQEVNQALSVAVEGWNQFLVGQPGWNQNKITVNVTPRENCAPSSQTLTIRAFINDASFQKLCSNMYPNIPLKDLPTKCRSHTYVKDHLINLEKESIDNRLDHVILHEYGHIIGMGDTYYEDGYIPKSATGGQPNSVMNGPNPLSPDDRDGIRAVWQAIRQGNSFSNFCSKGYVAKNGPNGMVFCKPVGNIPSVSQNQNHTQQQNHTAVKNDGVCPAVGEPGFNLKINQRFTYFASKSGVFVRQLDSQNQVNESVVDVTRSKCELVEISCHKEVIEKVGSYVKVKFADGKQGFVHGSQIAYRKAESCVP